MAPRKKLLNTPAADYNPLRWLMAIYDHTCRLMRRRLWRSPFYFSIIHRPGCKHMVSDAFSRLQHDLEPTFPSNEDEIPNFKDVTALSLRTRSGTLEDPDPSHPDYTAPQDDN